MTAYPASFTKGVELYEQGRLREAIPYYEHAIREAPDNINVLYRSMLLLVAMRDYQGAVRWIRQALDHIDEQATDPKLMAEFHYNLGCAYETLGKWETARTHHEHSLRFHDLVLPKVNLGSIAYRLGDPATGYDYHSQAIADHGLTDTEIQCGRSFLFLLRGDYARGFREYEARWTVPSVKAYSYLPDFGSRWDGESLEGKSILIISEQGVGDVLMALRFVPVIQSMGATVVLLVANGLRPLATQNFPDVTVIVKGDALECTPDYWIHTLSVPYVLGTTPETVPDAVWCRRVTRTVTLPTGKPRVGYVTKGNTNYMGDKDRSMPAQVAQRFERMLRSLNVEPICLHQDEERKRFGTTGLHETAGIIDQLNVLVSIDSAVAHLAGAMGKPVLMMPQSAPEWRWGYGERSPWYPTTHTIFRRSHVDRWEPVFAAVRTALEEIT